MSGMVPRPDTTPAITSERPRKSPLAPLPDDEWREAVGFFYAAYSDILKGSTGTVTRLRFWIHEDGLTLAEAKTVLKQLLRPSEAALIQFPGQLIARLAELVAEAVVARRKVQEKAAAKEQHDRDRTSAAHPDEVRRILAGRIGVMP